MEFKEITIHDKDIIQSFTLNSTRRNCDLSFSNLFSWRFMYHTKYAIVEDFLILRFYAEDELSYMMPIGKGDMKAVLEMMIEDAHKLGKPFQMLGVCVYSKDDIEAAMPGKFEFTSERDYADYIYLREDLANLTGKKYQSKRNHLNKFRKSYPDYEYVPITPELVPECLELEAKWCRANNCHEQEALAAERKSLTCALKNFEDLGLTGGILRVNGQIVAFTFGMPINHQTFDVSIEKADTSVDGAYTMINYEFVNQIPEQYIYINREEDLGIEGLRKAKLSYQPHIILEKCVAILKEDISDERKNTITMETVI